MLFTTHLRDGVCANEVKQKTDNTIKATIIDTLFNIDPHFLTIKPLVQGTGEKSGV